MPSIMIIKRIALLALILLIAGLTGLSLASCGSISHFGSKTSEDFAEVAPGQPMEDYIVEEAPTEEWGMDRGEPDLPDHEVTAPGISDPSLRYVIRRGSIDLSVSDTRKKVQEIQKIVREAEGIIAGSYVYEIREGQYGARMTLRVPENRFEAILEQLENLGKVTNIQTVLEDITMQYVDLESRLNNQEAQEKRLTEILDMAEKVEDVLEIEKELARVRGEIESMTARLTRLRDQVTYATINVSLREKAIPTGTVSPHAFYNLGNRISEAFIGSINFILNAASGLIVLFTALIPALFLLVVIGSIIWLLVHRHINKRAAAGSQNEGQAAGSDDKI